MLGDKKTSPTPSPTLPLILQHLFQFDCIARLYLCFLAVFFFAVGFPCAFLLSILATVSPISAGLCTVWIPAARIAAYFSAAVPCPPLMIAPACPIRRPGGAVWPAMNPTTGFFTCFLM